jgi:hypothetical protein
MNTLLTDLVEFNLRTGTETRIPSSSARHTGCQEHQIANEGRKGLKLSCLQAEFSIGNCFLGTQKCGCAIPVHDRFRPLPRHDQVKGPVSRSDQKGHGRRPLKSEVHDA